MASTQRKTGTQSRRRSTSQSKSTNKSKSTSSRKSTGGNKRTSRTKSSNRSTVNRTAKHKTQEELQLYNDIKLIAGFVVMLIFELSTFSLMGSLGKALSSFLFGMFGITAYVMPVFIFVMICMIVANISSSEIIKKIIYIFFMCWGFLSFIQLIYVGNEYGLKMASIYKDCSENHAGGGLLGGFPVALVASVLGVVGAYVLTIAFILTMIALVSGKSIIRELTDTSKDLYDYAKEDYAYMKNNSQERIANRERNRQGRKRFKDMSGVDMASSNVSPDAKINKDIHEIQRKVYRGHVSDNIDIDTSKIITSDVDNEIQVEAQNDIQTEVQNMVQDKISDEVKDVGEFRPKERIQVSKAAKAAMKRKAYSGTSIEAVPNTKPDLELNKANGKSAGKNITAGSKAAADGSYMMPPLNLLKKGPLQKRAVSRSRGLSETAVKLQETLNAFGVNASVINESRGPSVTRYELQPETGTKVSKITALADDIKLNLAASDIRIEAPIPGKAAVGIEVPNQEREPVFLRDLLESSELKQNQSKLAFAAGMDIAGKVVVADIAKMPHMLVAGTTGSGKSVFTNSIIMSILFRTKPEEVRMIIVDPKVVEFGVYNGIPHLLTPVVTDPKKAAGALNWAVGEMNRRYKEFAKYNVRDIKGYNQKLKEMNNTVDGEYVANMPQIVIIIDELADLMMVASKEVETSICRLAQLARAAGLHLIIATQRPSVDVVTGLIKANIPSRVSLLVSSGTDSRTIIDCNGGEKLLGNGDMLFYPSGYIKPVRLQGAFVSDGEVQDVVNFIKEHNVDVKYDEEVSNATITAGDATGSDSASKDEQDPLFEKAAEFVVEKQKGSTSMLQRMFKIGFNRASRLIDQMEKNGIVGGDEGTKPRKVLMSKEQFEVWRNGGAENGE